METHIAMATIGSATVGSLRIPPGPRQDDNLLANDPGGFSQDSRFIPTAAATQSTFNCHGVETVKR